MIFPETKDNVIAAKNHQIMNIFLYLPKGKSLFVFPTFYFVYVYFLWKLPTW